MTLTPGLDLTEHPSAGADSYVYANEAYRWLEVFAGSIAAEEFATTTPPTGVEGEIYILGETPTGDWAGNGFAVAMYLNGGWLFKAPKPGMHVLISTAASSFGKGSFALHNGTAWRIDSLAGTSAPTVTNDEDTSFLVGSRWIDTVADKEYVCLDQTAGAAVWKETTGAGGGGSGDPDQNIWYTMTGDAGVPMSPTSTATALAVSGGVGIGTVTGGTTLQIFAETADSTTDGIIDTSMWLSLRLADFYARGSLIEFEETAAQPAAGEGDAYFLPASPTGADWAGNGGTVAYYRDGVWRFITPFDGLRLNVKDSASSYLAGCLIAYSEAADLWYPVQDLETTTLHWTGRYINSKKIYAKTLSGSALGAGGVATQAAHGVTAIDLQEYAVARGWMGRTTGNIVSVPIPQNFSSTVVQVTISATNVVILSATDLSNYAYKVRLECVQTPEP
jgi:hypothetical protein